MILQAIEFTLNDRWLTVIALSIVLVVAVIVYIYPLRRNEEKLRALP